MREFNQDAAMNNNLLEEDLKTAQHLKDDKAKEQKDMLQEELSDSGIRNERVNEQKGRDV